LGLAPAEAKDRRAEANRELLDLHAVPLRQQEVAQLVDEDDEAQPQGDFEDIQQPDQGFQRSTSRRAQASTLHNVSSVGRGSNVCASRAARQARAMSRKPISPARNRATATSLAAFSAAPAVPPRRMTSNPRSRLGNVS